MRRRKRSDERSWRNQYRSNEKASQGKGTEDRKRAQRI